MVSPVAAWVCAVFSDTPTAHASQVHDLLWTKRRYQAKKRRYRLKGRSLTVKLAAARSDTGGAMSQMRSYEDDVLQRLHEVAAAARYVPAEHQPQRLQDALASLVAI